MNHLYLNPSTTLFAIFYYFCIIFSVILPRNCFFFVFSIYFDVFYWSVALLCSHDLCYCCFCACWLISSSFSQLFISASPFFSASLIHFASLPVFSFFSALFLFSHYADSIFLSLLIALPFLSFSGPCSLNFSLIVFNIFCLQHVCSISILSFLHKCFSFCRCEVLRTWNTVSIEKRLT